MVAARMLMLAFVGTGSVAPQDADAAPPREYALKGLARILGVTPNNPVRTSRFRPVIRASVQSQDGSIWFDFSMPGQPQHCRVRAKAKPDGSLVLDRNACEFHVLAFPARVTLPYSRATLETNRLRVIGTLVVTWMHYKGTIDFTLDGVPNR